MSQCNTCKKQPYCDIYKDIMDYENDSECLPDGKNWDCKWYSKMKLRKNE